MNKIILSGNLVRDIELTNAGSSVICKNAIAYNRKYKGVDETSYFEIDVWNKSAEYIKKYAKKGSKVLIEGELKSQTYTTKEGQNRTKTFINVFNIEIFYNKETNETSFAPKKEKEETFDIDDEDLPF